MLRLMHAMLFSPLRCKYWRCGFRCWTWDAMAEHEDLFHPEKDGK